MINYMKNEIIARNYLISFLDKFDIRHKWRSDDITHGLLDSQIMRKYLVEIVNKTISFLIFLVVRGRIWYKRTTKNLIWHCDKYTSWHIFCINVILYLDPYINIVWIQDELDPYTKELWTWSYNWSFAIKQIGYGWILLLTYIRPVNCSRSNNLCIW